MDCFIRLITRGRPRGRKLLSFSHSDVNTFLLKMYVFSYAINDLAAPTITSFLGGP